MFKKTLLSTLIVFMSSTAFANYVGSEVQYFNPTPDNMDFITVHSSRSLPEGTFKTTLFFDYAENIHYSDTFENNVVQAQLGFGVGVTDRLSFSVVGSGILDYNDDEGGAYTEDNFTHVRTNLKYSFCNCSGGGFALVASFGFGLMSPDFFVGDENDFGASLILAWDKMLTEKMRFGVNLGYRYRNSGDAVSSVPASAGAYSGFATSGLTRDGSDVLASLGFNYLINAKWTAVTEAYFQLPTDQFFDFTTPSDTYDQKGGEFLLGANYDVNDKMDLSFGGVLGLMDDSANADWRVFLGIGYAFGENSESSAFNMAGKGSAPKPVPAPVKEEVVQEKVVSIEDAPVLKAFDITAQFPSGSATLTNKAKVQLADVGNFIKANSAKIQAVFIEGHSDSQGNDEFNRMLSERRAQGVKNYIVRTYGLDVDKVKAVGYGETAPIADNKTAEGRAKNRRVIVKIK